MKLNKIRLENFRNYENFSAEFDPGVNLWVGQNAQGKTNLLEAVAFLGSGRAFRTQKIGELIRFGGDFAQIEGTVTSQQREQDLRWILFQGSRPRQLYRNGVKKKTAADIAGVLQTVLANSAICNFCCKLHFTFPPWTLLFKSVITELNFAGDGAFT